jgi:hypothetical protein
MIELFDTFNSVLISRHRTLEAAVKAQRKHLAAVRRHNGRDSYLTYGYVEHGLYIDPERIEEAQLKLDYK